MSNKLTAGKRVAPPEGSSAPEQTMTAAESFAAWWSANIPNSPISRDTAAYNRAFELKQRLLDVLSTVTGE